MNNRIQNILSLFLSSSERSPELRKKYQKYVFNLTVVRARIMLLVGVFLIPLFASYDYFVYPDLFLKSLLVRIADSFFLAALYYWLAKPSGQKHPYLISMAGFGSVFGMVLFVIHHTGGYESPYYAGLVEILLAFTVSMPWTWKKVVPFFALVYGAYLVPILLFQPITNWTVFINNNYFLVGAMFIATVMSVYMDLMQFSTFSSQRNLEISNYKLEKTNLDLKQVDRLKSDIISNVGHELRTPLTLILFPIELVLKKEYGNISLGLENVLNTVRTNAVKLLELVESVLDINRAASGNFSVKKSKGDICITIGLVVDSLQVNAQKKEISLKYSCSQIPEFNYDEGKIERLLINLIGNAIKFTPEKGQVEVLIQAIGRELECRVIDNGIGIPPEYLDKIFERFFQVHGSNTGEYQGSGLGLTLCKEIVEKHNGSIWAESNPGVGTTLAFRLPLEDYEEATLNRRKQPRINITRKVRYIQDTPLNAFTKSIGEGGMMIDAPTPLVPGTKLEMILYHAPFVIPFEAEVLWVKKDYRDDSERFKTGLKFIKKPGDDLMHIQYLVQSSISDSAV